MASYSLIFNNFHLNLTLYSDSSQSSDEGTCHQEEFRRRLLRIEKDDFLKVTISIF